MAFCKICGGKLEKNKQYRIELNDNSVVENFYVYEITESFLLGCTQRTCIENIKKKNNGEDVVCKGEFILRSDIKNYKELFENLLKN